VKNWFKNIAPKPGGRRVLATILAVLIVLPMMPPTEFAEAADGAKLSVRTTFQMNGKVFQATGQKLLEVTDSDIAIIPTGKRTLSYDTGIGGVGGGFKDVTSVKEVGYTTIQGNFPLSDNVVKSRVYGPTNNLNEFVELNYENINESGMPRLVSIESLTAGVSLTDRTITLNGAAGITAIVGNPNYVVTVGSQPAVVTAGSGNQILLNPPAGSQFPLGQQDITI
jgi:hypothetical protein